MYMCMRTKASAPMRERGQWEDTDTIEGERNGRIRRMTRSTPGRRVGYKHAFCEPHRRAECNSARRAIPSGIGATQDYRLTGAMWPCNHTAEPTRSGYSVPVCQHRTQTWRERERASERATKQQATTKQKGGMRPLQGDPRIEPAMLRCTCNCR